MKNIFIALLTISLIIVGYFYISEKQNHSTATTKTQALVQSLTQANNTLKETNKKRNQEETSQEITAETPPAIQANNVGGIEAKTPEKAQLSANEVIKQKFCTESSRENACFIDFQSNFQNEMVGIKGNIQSNEVEIILASANFDDVITELSSTKATDQAYEIEANYNGQINDILADFPELSTAGVGCNDEACAVNFSYQDNATWETIVSRFFTTENKTGSAIMQGTINPITNDPGMRVIFFPGAGRGISTK